MRAHQPDRIREVGARGDRVDPVVVVHRILAGARLDGLVERGNARIRMIRREDGDVGRRRRELPLEREARDLAACHHRFHDRRVDGLRHHPVEAVSAPGARAEEPEQHEVLEREQQDDRHRRRTGREHPAAPPPREERRRRRRQDEEDRVVQAPQKRERAERPEAGGHGRASFPPRAQERRGRHGEEGELPVRVEAPVLVRRERRRRHEGEREPHGERGRERKLAQRRRERPARHESPEQEREPQRPAGMARRDLQRDADEHIEQRRLRVQVPDALQEPVLQERRVEELREEVDRVRAKGDSRALPEERREREAGDEDGGGGSHQIASRKRPTIAPAGCPEWPAALGSTDSPAPGDP